MSPLPTFYYTDLFVLPLPDGHRFPMDKYSRLRRRVSVDADLAGVALRIPPAAEDRELALAHDRDYIARVRAGGLAPAEQRRIGFPWSPQLVERSRRSVGATIAACDSALDDGVAANLAGGTHHAFRDRGEGFCVFNDAVVAARRMQQQGRVRRVLIVDLDVHQGNGTAAIAAGDPTIFTLSIHGAGNFPFRKERGDLDVALPDGTGDAAYLEALERYLPRALEQARPELTIYLAGADPFEGDRFGRLALSREGLAGRDRIVLSRCRRAGVPVAVTMAGGYARDVDDTVAIHHETLRAAVGW